MLFNSIQFLAFFPIVCLVYFIAPLKLKNTVLLVASYYFYACWNLKYLILLFASTLITWISGFLLDKADTASYRKLIVAASFLSNLAILFFFKYFTFFLENTNRLFSLLNINWIIPSFDILLPVGISFYTFQALSYTMDVYRKKISAEKDLLSYALFVSFFPQLVAGPIERSSNLLPQMHEQHRFDYDRCKRGFLQMLYGYYQKMVISETAAIFVTEVYNNYSQYSGTLIVVATIMFGIQIYCDFGGYSNIAIGAARILGFNLMENFHNPYFAVSVSDFWRRWHISLTTWFRDYLYIPLGGNRKGKIRKYINIMIVFLASGLWHGASWHYVIWGGINGINSVLGDLTYPARQCLTKKMQIDTERFSSKLCRIIGTFVLVDFAWLFFKANNLSHAMGLIKTVFMNFYVADLFNGSLYSAGLSRTHMSVFCVALMVLLAIDIMKETGIDILEWYFKQSIIFRFIIYWLLLFAILVFGVYGPKYDSSAFIYFQF